MPFYITEATAPFKVIVFFLAWIGCWLPVAIPTAYALKWHPAKPLGAVQKIALLASLYPIAPLLLWVMAGMEGMSFSIYGLALNPSVLISLGLGLVIGVGSIIGLFAIEWALGWINWRWEAGIKLFGTLLTTLLVGLWVSGTEELVFRGFLLNEFQQEYSPWIAALASSLIFTFLHLVWEIRETVPQLPGLFLLGIVLVLARWVDRGSLGLAWGLHAGWIWAIATIDTLKLVAYTGKGSVWITGLSEKPLAGGAGIFCMLVTGAVLLLFCR